MPSKLKLSIHNVRLGHANNSSSTHSMFILPDGVSLADDIEEPFQYGWEAFVLATKEARTNYLAVALHMMLEHSIGKTFASAVVKDLLGVDTSKPDWVYIDHQSQLTLPRNWNQPMVPDMEFFEEFKTWLLQDGLVIFGGNDNSDEGPDAPFGATDVTLPIVDLDKHQHFVCRKDPKGFWTLFNRKTGAKVRLSFDPNVQVGKSTMPELVDLKITDACPFKCEFCYQSSLPQGLEGDSHTLHTIVANLAKMRVFEVAIGGGEPTLYKGFPYLLHEMRRSGIVPNFTTRNLAWLKDPVIVKAVAENAGSFAYSVHEPEEVEALMLAFGNVKHLFDSSFKPTVQVVMGTMENYWVFRILEECAKYDFPVTLLGFKETGFGKSFKKKDYSEWMIDLINHKNENADFKLPRLNIDTALALESKTMLEAKGVPKISYHVIEGAHSLYIDGVTKKIGPSSYCKPEEMVQFLDWPDLPKLFALWPGE